MIKTNYRGWFLFSVQLTYDGWEASYGRVGTALVCKGKGHRPEAAVSAAQKAVCETNRNVSFA